MPEPPNWTDKVSAISAVVSTILALGSMVALIVIASFARSLEEELRDLTFPVPSPEFSLEPIAVRRPFPQNITFDRTGSMELLVTGFSKDQIVLEEVQVERILGLPPGEFAEQKIELNLDDKAPIISPQADGLLDQSVPLTYTARIRKTGIDPSEWELFIPLELGLEFRVVWFESKTLRRHTTTASTESVFTVE